MSEQRLSVTFGAFSCDVVGYNDPFAILNRVVELFGEVARDNPAFGAGKVGMSDMERARIAAGLSGEASRLEELADQSTPSGRRYVVTRTEDHAEAALAADSANDAATDDVVVAALADEAGAKGDLELRDTIEADGVVQEDEEEIVALDLTPALAIDGANAESAAAPAADAGAGTDDLSEEEIPATETVVVADAAPEASEALAEKRAAAEPLKAEKGVAEVADAPVETPAARPQRRPLRLNMSTTGVAPKTEETRDEAPEAPNPVEETKSPRQRVTITKLPLRPETPDQVKQTLRSEINLRHALSPVQKVEPVVTVNTTIEESDESAARLTRAERFKANIEKRSPDDELDNFLFADVDETAVVPETPHAAGSEDEPPMFGAAASEAGAADDEAAKPAKKSRRSFASFLGFGRTKDEEPAAKTEPAPVANGAPAPDYKGGADGFDRLRATVAAAIPDADKSPVKQTVATQRPETISEAIDYDDETSPTAFARRVGATTLQDLLEASAVYMDLVEGKSRFSRRDVMQALHQIDSEKDYSQEARLKSFRKLLTTGSLVRVDDGMFTVSQATRFGYESQLHAS